MRPLISTLTLARWWASSAVRAGGAPRAAADLCTLEPACAPAAWSLPWVGVISPPGWASSPHPLKRSHHQRPQQSASVPIGQPRDRELCRLAGVGALDE